MAQGKTTIYLIRHGECEGNKEKRIRGHVDFPLNENGIAQAEALAEALTGKGICRIYSSPLSRAMKTAEIISKKVGADYKADEGFNNICIGIWENRLKAELAAEVPDMWETWLNRPEDLIIEGGESLDRVRERSLASLNRVAKEHEGKTIAIVGHRGVLKPLVAGALDVAKPCYWKFHFDTASYSMLTYDAERGYCLMNLNYTEHLKGMNIIQEFD